jgi:FkbM family methyltransferase
MRWYAAVIAPDLRLLLRSRLSGLMLGTEAVQEPKGGKFDMRTLRQFAAVAARRLLSPVVPARKRLPFSYWLLRFSGENLPEFYCLDQFIAGAEIAVDVGANVGLFTYPLSRRFKHVYSFEINDEISVPINQYNPGNITLYSCGLSSTARLAKLYIPVIRNISISGWASLYRDNLPEAQSFIEKEAQVRPLDDFNLAGVDFIKIDVEGHEIEVIKGAIRTIESSRPVILVEVKGQNLRWVSDWFKQRDFLHCDLDAHFHLGQKNCNQLYVPAEKADRIRFDLGVARPVSAGQSD